MKLSTDIAEELARQAQLEEGDLRDPRLLAATILAEGIRTRLQDDQDKDRNEE